MKGFKGKERDSYDFLSNKLEELANEYNNNYYIDIEPCYLTIFPDGRVCLTLIVNNKEILIMSCQFYTMNGDSLENALARHFKKKIDINKKEKEIWREKNEND